jgi:hypothetical protein
MELLRGHVDFIELKITNTIKKQKDICKHVRCPAQILQQAQDDSLLTKAFTE